MGLDLRHQMGVRASRDVERAVDCGQPAQRNFTSTTEPRTDTTRPVASDSEPPGGLTSPVSDIGGYAPWRPPLLSQIIGFSVKAPSLTPLDVALYIENVNSAL